MSQEGLPISCNLSSASTSAFFSFHHHHHHQKCCYQSDLTYLPQQCSSSELSRPCRHLYNTWSLFFSLPTHFLPFFVSCKIHSMQLIMTFVSQMPLRWVFPGRPGTSGASRPSHLISGSCAYSHLPDHRIYLSDYRTCAWKTSLFLCPQFRCQDKVLLHDPRVSLLYPYGSSSSLPTTAKKKTSVKPDIYSPCAVDPPRHPLPCI